MKIKDAHPPTLFETEFPKFIYSKQGGREYIVHLHWPKFIAEVKITGEEFLADPIFFDTPSAVDTEDLVEHMSKIMDKLGDFYENVINDEI